MVDIKRSKEGYPRIERSYISFGDRHESFGAINERGQEILIGNILVDEEPKALNAQALGIDKDMIEGEV